MPLVAGVDSSIQSCKIVIREVASGRLVRQGRALHPPGTEVHPSGWWSAFQQAAADAGGLADVAAISIAAHQHAMICLDEDGVVIRPALLWNDTRSAVAARDLTTEIDPTVWATAVGIVPVASFTIAKLRWLAEHEPANAARVAAVCLPHDWLTWRLSGSTSIRDLVTDRSDASGTGYFDPRSGNYRRDLLMLAFGRDVLPRVAAAAEAIPSPGSEFYPAGLLAPGAADNAAAAFGLDLGDQALVSLGTSGTACGISTQLPNDPSGVVAGFADLRSQFLALTCTLNAARVLDVTARLIGTDLAGLSDGALRAAPGAAGLSMVAYLEGERTPNLPEATGSIHGMNLVNTTPDNLARAAIEGMLCGQAVGLDAIAAQGCSVSEVYLIGGVAQSPAAREIAPTVFGVPVLVPPPGEYAADGAARQAGWALSGDATPPTWPVVTEALERYDGAETCGLRERYHAAASLHLDRPRVISPEGPPDPSTGDQ